MSNFIKNIFLLILISGAALSFTIQEKQEDQLSDHLQEQFNKYEKTNIDSATYYGNQLIKHSQNISNDSLHIISHLRMGNIYRSKRLLDSSYFHYNIALQIAETCNNPYLTIRSHLIIGNNCFLGSELEKAITHYNKALKLAQQHQITKEEAVAYIQLGNIYWEQGNFQKALQTYLNANTITETNNFRSLRLSTLMNIANIYTSDKQWEIALKKMNEVLDLANKEKKTSYQALANNNIGSIYEKMGLYSEAFPYYLETSKLQKKAKNITGIALANHNLGSINFRLGKYAQAVAFLNKSIASNREINSKLDLVYDYEYLARIYIKRRNFDKANYYLKRAINYSQDLKLVHKNIELSKLKSEFFFEQNELKKAYQTLIQHDSLKDDFVKNERSDKIIRMQTQYESVKKEKENDLLKSQNQLTQLNLEKETQRKNQVIIVLAIALSLFLIIVALLRHMIKANKTIKEFNVKLEESNGKLQLMNSTKDKFFTIIAHDLRSPLGGILGFSNLISDETSSTKEIETIKEYNTYLNQSARNLHSLLENLLQWAKSQLGSIKYQATDFDLSEVIKDNIEIQKLKAKEKSIKIVSKLEANTSVFADINMINTVIRNLLSNALKFSHRNSEVIISAKVDTDSIQLSIRDKGLGISMENQKKLFNIDNNFSTVGTNEETGTGLGLILCKEFVETNGGKIWVDSMENRGSIFTFSLPRNKV